MDKGELFNKKSQNLSSSDLYLQTPAMNHQKRDLAEEKSSHVNLSDGSLGQRSSDSRSSVVVAALSPSSTVSTDMNGLSSTGQSPTLMMVAETDGGAEVNIGKVSDPQGSDRISDPQGSGRISCIFKTDI